jgi:hypothetical protein
MAIKRVSGADRGYYGTPLTISSLALVADSLVDFDRSNAKVIASTSSSGLEDIAGVTVEASTTSDTQIKVQKITEHDEYIVDTTNNSNVAHNYQRMVLTDASTVNNTGTDSAADTAVFCQLETVGAASDKKIRGYFITRMDAS